MGHRFLDDIANTTPGTLTISSSSLEQCDPHLPDDLISLPIRMTEAIDDSIIFARTIPTLQKFCLIAEHFLYAYGWLTNWLKTTAFILSPSGPQPTMIQMPLITVEPGLSLPIMMFH